MSEAPSGMQELHRLLKERQELLEQLEDGPRRVAARRRVIEKREAEAAELKQRLTQLQKASDQKNLQFKVAEQKITELKIKLNQASTNKEFDIIKAQIASESEASEKVEAEYLELLEQIDASQAEIAEARAVVEQVTAEANKLQAEVDAKRDGLQAQINELNPVIRRSEACLPGPLRDPYRRMVETTGASAVAKVEEGACPECFEEMTPQQNVELRSLKPILCRSCNRILYITAESLEG